MPLKLRLAFIKHHNVHYQASVRVEDEEGPEDEAEEELHRVDVGGGVAHVDQQPAEDFYFFKF